MLKIKPFIAFMCLVLVPTLLVSTLTGCPAMLAALPDVIAAVTDGTQILDAIESFCTAWFIQHPSVESQQKVSEAIAKARLALNIALRTAQGAKNLDDASIDAAFNDFKNAYIELLSLVKPYGVKESALPSMKMRAAPGELVVPQPLAFRKGAH